MRGIPRVLAIFLLASTAIAPALALASPALPKIGTFTDQDLRDALFESLSQPLEPAADWEETEGQMDDLHLPGGDGSLPVSDDNDTAHYMRGRTLIIHIFINHTGDTWTSAERDDAGAKAAVAKNHYLTNAPAGANVSFDFEGTNDYWFYETTVNYFIPDSGMNDTVVDDVLAALGFADSDGDGTRVDDFTFSLQNWGGGWDNVLACFEPDQTGRGWASYGTARTYLYRDSNANTWAHEWGHLYGACDEYVEGGQCNGGIDCGPCQSWYLDSIVDNGNCQLVTCPSDVACLMINNTFTNICDYTLDHWGWVDGDNNGLLDTHKRRVMGDTFVNIYELYHNGWFYWNNVDHGMVISQKWNSWAVVGLRSPATADYDLKLLGDNNHSFQYASSAWGGTSIDFIVGDYNHSPIGNEHIEVSRWSGDNASYNLTWESGTGMLYPDGVARSGSWYDYNVVRVWDVPLFAGEEVTFTLDITGGSIDLGMGLFRSNGGAYWAPRSSAEWLQDGSGIGGTESYTYTVPADDVYGLVVWANSSVDGSFTIQIGPAPVTLAEESPYNSAWDLRLYNYDPNSLYWAFAGTRPEPGTGVGTRLFDDSDYQNELEESDDYGSGAMEFFAVDYNPGYSRDHLRVVKNLGGGNHRTEWEQDPEIISGALPTADWSSPHLGKVWDAWLLAGETYFLREYHDFATPLDTGIYLMSSADGDRYIQRNDYDGASNFRDPTEGGEWFSYTAPADDWYGIIQIVNDESSGPYSLWLGAQINLAEDGAVTRSDEVLWGSATVSSYYWTVFAARPGPGEQASVWLYGDNAYTITTLAVSDQSSNPVTYVVGDYNHNPTGLVYPRFRRGSGYAEVDVEWEGGADQLVYTPGSINTYDLTWPAGDVAEIWDLFADPDREIQIQVDDLSGAMDLGIAFFGSLGASYYANRNDAMAAADANGVGGSESITVTTVRGDYYGFVVMNNNDAGGGYRIRVIDPATASVMLEESPSFGLRALAGNPFRDSAVLELSLDHGGLAELAIFDVTGREVRSLLGHPLDTGTHRVVWDGRDTAGNPVAAGLYFARLRMGTEERRVKLVRSR